MRDVRDTNYLLALLGRNVRLELEQDNVDEGSNVGHCCVMMMDDARRTESSRVVAVAIP